MSAWIDQAFVAGEWWFIRLPHYLPGFT